MSKIGAYIITFPDEVDVIDNPIRCLLPLADEIVVVDGGWDPPPLCYGVREGLPPMKDLVESWKTRHPSIHYVHHPWPHVPGAQRNYAEGILKQDGCDWIIALDSDEVFDTHTSAHLRSMFSVWDADSVVAVKTTLYGLYQDERHYSDIYALTGPMAHPRIHRSGGTWTPTWHEHYHFDGKVANWGSTLHLRTLWPNRLIRQRGQTIEQAWGTMKLKPLPQGIVAPEIVWPGEDR